MQSQKVLLLNASNLEKFPVYPYAFIQVPALARQSGIEVICKDLLGISREQWKSTVQALIQQHDPLMILITLRNMDSCELPDYRRKDSTEENQNAYFPIERTRELIATIRQISDLKIAVGGFAFSLLPDELMHYLRPDFGVYEGPNDFFAKFEQVRKGILSDVTNLLFFAGEQLISNPRKLYPPLAEAEYTPQAIEAMMEFYAASPSPGFLGAPVEALRGCNHHCVFCAEPYAKGGRLRYRDLSVVMKDIEILVDHGITRIYIISSELNPEGNEFTLELADRIWSFNASQPKDRKVTWHGANYLLKFDFDEYERLYRSGFTGGWFDITALDDENARAMRTPYRNARLLEHLKTYAKQQQKQRTLLQAQKAAGSQAKVCAGGGGEDDPINWTMFLGNPATTIETIRNTLQVADQDGLSQLFERCGLNTYTRVFDYEKPDEAMLNATYSVTPNLEHTGYQQIFPSFAYPPALLQHFGSEAEIDQMFAHIADTYLSTRYLQTRDWTSFLKQKSSPDAIMLWIKELSKIKKIQIPDPVALIAKEDDHRVLQKLFSEKLPEEEIQTYQQLAKRVVDFLLSANIETFPGQFETFGFPTSREAFDHMTPYELTRSVFTRWAGEDELLHEFRVCTSSKLNTTTQELVLFVIQAMLYTKNIVINPKYRELFAIDASPVQWFSEPVPNDQLPKTVS